MRKTILAALLAAPLLAGAAHAETPPVDGEVRKIDAAQGKITLKHGPIKNLDMDGMTMVFRVKDPAMLKGLKPGDKVKFEADRVDGRITIIKLEKAK
ncbi:MAG: copper-binding protein [Rhodospirillaceae bacterium]|nr:copper-binding protein [Rhodospirillaceae bacterium]